MDNKEKYLRRDFLALTGIAALSGCADQTPLDSEEEEEENNTVEPDPEIMDAAEEAQQELIDNETLLTYQEADGRITADSLTITAEVTREVGIGDAREHRIRSDVDMRGNASDIPGFAENEREVLLGVKLNEPSYDISAEVFDRLLPYDARERNVHENRVTEYETRFNGDEGSFVRYRIASDRLDELETREDYLEDFRSNAEIWDGEDWI